MIDARRRSANMPTTTRPRTLPQLLVTTLAAVITAALYLYLTRPQAPRVPSRLVADRLAAPMSVSFDKTRLADVFQTLSQQIGVNIAVDWQILEGPGLDRDTSVTFAHAASAADVLDALLQEHPFQGNVVWAERDGQIVISDDGIANAPVVRMYDISPLLDEQFNFSPLPQYPQHGYPMGVGLFQTSQADSAHPADAIMNILTSAVDVDSWLMNGGRIGQMEYAMNRLVVSQTPANHAKIQRILVALGLNDGTAVADSDPQGSPR
jgi:hypothetical protein